MNLTLKKKLGLNLKLKENHYLRLTPLDIHISQNKTKKKLLFFADMMEKQLTT